MPTRLYLSDAQAAPVSPGFGAWGETSEAVRRLLLQAKEAGEALNLGTRIGWAPGVTQLDRQYVCDALSGDQTISGTLKLQLATREFNNGDNSTSRLLVKVVSGDGGTLRGTLLALGQYGPATEFINNASLRNKTFADGDSLTSVAALDGDRIVVEIGFADASGATPEGQARYGAPTGTADHAENETETTSLVPWVEFSGALTFQAVPRRAAISWAELEVPLAPRRGAVSWAEMEVPAAPRRGAISWAQLEVPTAPRRGALSWAEIELPAAPRRAAVSWTELEVPSLGGTGALPLLHAGA